MQTAQKWLLLAPKVASTSTKGSSSLASFRKDSNYLKSYTREMSINKLISPSPVCSGNIKRFEKPMFKAKKTPKWIDKRRMTRSMKRLDKSDRYF